MLWTACVNKDWQKKVWDLSFSDKTMKLSHNAQFCWSCVVLWNTKGGLINAWVGFKTSFLISKGLRWRQINRPVLTHCVCLIYSLPFTRETTTVMEALLLYYRDVRHQKYLQTCIKIPNAILAHTPQPCIVSASLLACFLPFSFTSTSQFICKFLLP